MSFLFLERCARIARRSMDVAESLVVCSGAENWRHALSDEILELRQKIELLEQQIELDRMTSATLFVQTIHLLYPIIRMSLSLHEGEALEAKSIFSEFEARVKDMERGLEDYRGNDE